MSNKEYRKHFSVWLLPGLSLKRWLGSLLIGVSLLLIGFAMMLDLHPVANFIKLIQSIGPEVPAWEGGLALILAGLFLVYFGWRKATNTMFDVIAANPMVRADLVETLYREGQLRNGPKIVAIGGGTGLSTLLRGLKAYTSNITAVVTVADDGGSSGRLREEFGIIPPGDIRNCIAALADEESLITSLFQYRFQSGSGLEGHSFGNLFLSVLCEISGNMVSAVKESSKILKIRGRVLPATLENVSLIADLEDGREVVGESMIPKAGSKITQLRCNPSCPLPLPEVIDAIKEAELIILGPGSLYTSVIPNLLIQKIAEALEKSKAPKIYICNVMTQPGETDGFSVSDHVKAILSHAKNRKVISTVVVNSEVPSHLAAKYSQYNAYPIKTDYDVLQQMGLEIIERTLLEEGEVIRHNTKKLSRAIITWFKRYQRNQNASRLERATGGFISNKMLLGKRHKVMQSSVPPTEKTPVGIES